MTAQTLTLHLRAQTLTQDDNGHTCWQVVETEKAVSAKKTALLLCDVWVAHWSRGASERVEAMVPRLNEVVHAARDRGVQIVHAPSDTLTFYQDHPARQRIQAVPPITPPTETEHDDPQLPIDDTDGGSDTGETPWHKAWTRQHPGIEIDPQVDVISEQGTEIYAFLQQRGIAHLLIAGVHTNMCILNRSFGIKQMVRWGVDVALVRDLTDTMYNPARSPYVSHDHGTQLVIEYIEKFWCPTLHSHDLVTV
jgi:nicotinamidase-related amidase